MIEKNSRLIKKKVTREKKLDVSFHTVALRAV